MIVPGVGLSLNCEFISKVMLLLCVLQIIIDRDQWLLIAICCIIVKNHHCRSYASFPTSAKVRRLLGIYNMPHVIILFIRVSVRKHRMAQMGGR